LLEQAALPHRIWASGIDEDAITDPDPTLLVQRLAEAKANTVAQMAGDRCLAADGTPCGAVLACDSVLCFEGEVFGKPRDGQQAIERWQRMAGRWAELHTGHCLLRWQPEGSVGGASAPLLATVTTRVQLADLDLAAITTARISALTTAHIAAMGTDQLVAIGSDRIAALLPNATVLRLQDAGHGVTHQLKDVVNRALLEHFARAGS
jgi:predicted house-cleaning NTP pyrophosphatase (Maf/HAM1 superfamily)